MTRDSIVDAANFAAVVAGAFFVRNLIAMIGLASITFFALFSV
jgi:hypothetical protein